jgi:hypothetical protein
MIHFYGRGPDWLSGGAFGPEGSFGTTLVTIIVLALIWKFLQNKEYNGYSTERADEAGDPAPHASRQWGQGSPTAHRASQGPIRDISKLETGT